MEDCLQGLKERLPGSLSPAIRMLAKESHRTDTLADPLARCLEAEGEKLLLAEARQAAAEGEPGRRHLIPSALEVNDVSEGCFSPWRQLDLLAEKSC